MSSRLQLLRETLTRRPLLGDGATGTQLQLLGLAPGVCGELWCLDHPDRVQQVHRAYLAAGSDLLTTNSFGGTSFVLAGHGAGARVREINVAAARLAREVAGDRAWVLGDIGPFGGMFEPFGDAQHDEVIMAFCEQAAALLEGGADAILIETMSDPVEAALAVAAAKSVGAEYIAATYAFQQSAGGYRTMMGSTVSDCLAAVIDAGADAVGANCGTDLSLADYEKLTVELLAAAGRTPLIVQPNAGSPKLVDGKIHYATSPADFAASAARVLATGARIVGGCCGSTPAHIAAMAALFSR